MEDIQHRERQEASRAPVDVRLSTIEDKARLRRKKLADKAADYTITAGGIAVILSIVAILFVIVAETLPLWRSPTTTPLATLNLNQPNYQSVAPLTAAASPERPVGNSLAFGVDEYQSIAYVLRDNGVVDFLALPGNQLLQRYEIKALQGQKVTAANRNGLSHDIAVGTANGSVIPLRISFTTNRQEGKRGVAPEIKEGKAIQVDPQGRAITRLVYREEDGKVAAAALLGPRELIFLAQEEKTSPLGESSVEECARTGQGEKGVGADDGHTVHLRSDRSIFDESEIGTVAMAFAHHPLQDRHDGPAESACAEESVERTLCHLVHVFAQGSCHCHLGKLCRM